MSLFRNLAAVAAATFLFLTGSAKATPIIYEFSGTAREGSLNGIGFANRSFTVDVLGDTSGVISGGPGLLLNTASSVTYSIAGVGSGSLLDTYRMFLTSDAVGFSHLPGGDDRIDVLNGTFAGYALASAFGPVTTGSHFIGQFLPDATTAGPLDMFGGSNVSFRSFFPTAQAPEPASLVLLALGLIGLGFSRRKSVSM
jgi:PEP-CTERM motif